MMTPPGAGGALGGPPPAGRTLDDSQPQGQAAAAEPEAPAPAPPPVDLLDPRNYINRELSLLAFNARVLEQAKDPRTPLLERLRFLCISSSNLDEFFEIRFSGLKQQIALGLAKPELDGLSPAATLEAVSQEAHRLVAEQYRVLQDVLLPALEAAGIRVVRRQAWTPAQQEWVHAYFSREVLPVLTPVGLDPAHPFPRVLNKSLNFIVSLEGSDAYERTSGTAVVQVPRLLPRLIQMPPRVASGPHDFVLLSSVIHAHVGELFPGMRISGCYQFRLTRNSDLWVDEEEVDDLLRALKGELPGRNYGDAVRLEMPVQCSPYMAQFLLAQFKLPPQELYKVDGPVNLHRLSALYDLVNRPDLKYPPFAPTPRPALDIFEQVRRGDVLLHHPYQAFTPVVELLRQAAEDPNVLAIKMTVYRMGAQSPMAEALIGAARAGKEVTAVVELRARFDEATNIDLATRLQEAGAKVAYGIVGFKAHAKLLLVVRREGAALRRYVHLGTGNYHTGTARAYTDFSLMTCEERTGEDVHRLFQQMTGLGRVVQLSKLLQSPFTLHARVLELIEQEAAEARAGRQARIVAKLNSLSEPGVIQALYRASQAGVQVDLIVRGVCCLRPGVPGLSERIRVRGIVGRFLEHSRIYYFYARGQELTYLASADWMQRNFFKRVEIAFPIVDPVVRQQVLEDGLWTCLQDNVQAWDLLPDGTYRRSAPTDAAPPHCAQELLMERLAT
ncbi:MAG: polyphosphate kinase 1 [Planctomycetes bacterium]|nr:polyphosphate kinase 1 [Planctomycetota bacterium]